MPLTTDIAVIGGGPAGLAAAVEAAQTGARVVLVDENRHVGGQYLRPAAAEAPNGASGERTSTMRRHLIAAAERHNVQILSNSLVWGAFEERSLMLYGDDASTALQADALVLATGAYDRPVPFPGWTLPGVMTAGAAQTFAKSHSINPGRRMLLAGSGPFLLPVAQHVSEIGTEVVALAEATRPREWLRRAPATWGQWARFAEGWRYMKMLRRKGIPLRFGHKVVEALGSSSVEAAVICKVDRNWRRVPGTEQTLEVDAIAVGYGFVPSTELAELLGCELEWDRSGGLWQVACDERLLTSQAGVFAAGEITGIGGADLSLVEGRLAGLGAAEAVGAITSTQADDARRPMMRVRRRVLRFSEALNELFSPRDGLWEGMEEATLVCRCEEVSAGEIRERIRGGCTTPKQLKDWTRAQMGLCQGRMCGPAITRLLAEGTGQPLEAIPRASVRPPIKPVPIQALLQTEEP